MHSVDIRLFICIPVVIVVVVRCKEADEELVGLSGRGPCEGHMDVEAARSDERLVELFDMISGMRSAKPGV